MLGVDRSSVENHEWFSCSGTFMFDVVVFDVFSFDGGGRTELRLDEAHELSEALFHLSADADVE